MLDEFATDYSILRYPSGFFLRKPCSFAKRFLLVFETHQKAFFSSKQPRTLNSSPIENNPRVSPPSAEGGRTNQADNLLINEETPIHRYFLHLLILTLFTNPRIKYDFQPMVW